MRAPDFWHRPGGVLPGLLAPLGWAYGAVSRFRFAVVRPMQGPVPVLCVGNLVAGGAGKTPVALALGRRLAEKGSSVHFLTRGYGGRAEGPLMVNPGRHSFQIVGDEALLLAEWCPTWVSRNRPQGYKGAVEAGADMVIMDDGFQNPSLAKAVSLVVVDGGYGFGNGHVMPAGPLREPVEAGLGRADALVLVGEDQAGVVNRVRRSTHRDIPILRAHIRPDGDPGNKDERPVIAFAGIGHPEKFFHTVRSAGYTIYSTRPFPDHHAYSEQEIEDLMGEATTAGAQLMTTSKDAVRLDPIARGRVGVLTIAVQWEDEAALDMVLRPLQSHG